MTKFKKEFAEFDLYISSLSRVCCDVQERVWWIWLMHFKSIKSLWRSSRKSLLNLMNTCQVYQEFVAMFKKEVAESNLWEHLYLCFYFIFNRSHNSRFIKETI